MEQKDLSMHMTLLEDYLSFLKGLSPSEIEDLISGISIIKFSVEAKSKKILPARTATEMLKDEIMRSKLIEIKEKLILLTIREDGYELIERECPTRVHLEALAKIIDIPVTKRDNIEHIKKKIVENTIGYKLRSDAVRNK